MVSAREYLKELINRGESLQNPQYNTIAINSAVSLLNTNPRDTAIRDWMREISRT